ncbi:hypothetical protein DdX_17436 [Ditylenchus destructor]|uniref:Uncharacterized protein n=1 Tax=Ditylenchus destructor TaxID=166010 RepID=A0AAD4QTF2_9BILA|nr:hypothetical protein DdX_17436 [Ditylenchus destructor]
MLSVALLFAFFVPLFHALKPECSLAGYANRWKKCVGNETCAQWYKYVECRTEIGLAGHEAKYNHFKVACEQNYTVCGTSGSKMKGLDCATVLPHTTDAQPGKLCKLNAVPSPCSDLTKYLEWLMTKKNETGYGPQMPYAEMYKKQCDVEEPHPCPNTTVEIKVTNTTMTTPFALFNFSSDPENATEETENVLSIAHRAL